MALRPHLREAIRRRKERLATKRMAFRLAVLLGLVILATAAYWQFQVRQALQAARADNMLEACSDLEETDELVESGNTAAATVDEDALAQRLADCEEAGF